jgi:hypothetical protein
MGRSKKISIFAAALYVLCAAPAFAQNDLNLTFDNTCPADTTISAGGTLDVPARNGLLMPPVNGSGQLVVQSTFQFLVDNSSGSSSVIVTPSIGVSNPSGQTCAMAPYTGIAYPSADPVTVKAGSDSLCDIWYGMMQALQHCHALPRIFEAG